LEFVRLALARIVLHYIRVKVLLFDTAVKLFEHLLCGCSNSSAGSVDVPLTRALDGLSKNDGMGLLFRAVHYLPIVSGTIFRRNLKFTCVVLL
jgi:hypothetical protein